MKNKDFDRENRRDIPLHSEIPGTEEELVRDGWCSPEFPQGCILREDPKPDFS